jgi:tetratricopeptide (TPR) repeat protein
MQKAEGRIQERFTGAAYRFAVLFCFLPSAFCLLLSGCGPSRAERRADRALASYFAGDYRDAYRQLAPLAEQTNENFVLNNLRLGSAALHDYDFDAAEAAFLRAYEVLNSYGVNDGGRTLGAVLVDEKVRIWRGEPYERAMANFYLGLIYYTRGDYANARGAFENALFKLRDYVVETDDRKDKGKSDDDDAFRSVESNFAVAALMLGKCWQRLGREDLAKANFARAAALSPRLDELTDYDRNARSNVLLVIEIGAAPQKVTDFDGSIVGFSPSPARAGPPPLARVRVDGQVLSSPQLGEPTVDTVLMAHDRRWQSLDTIRAVKSAVGTGLLFAGAYEGLHGLHGHGDDQRHLTAAAILLGAGLFLKATSQADVRQWEMLPRAVYVIPLELSPGKHNVTVDFPGVYGLRQEWHGLVAPERGEATHFMRVDRYNHGPFSWPPESTRVADNEIADLDVK